MDWNPNLGLARGLSSRLIAINYKDRSSLDFNGSAIDKIVRHPMILGRIPWYSR
jgi:hypothetical protein